MTGHIKGLLCVSLDRSIFLFRSSKACADDPPHLRDMTSLIVLKRFDAESFGTRRSAQYKNRKENHSSWRPLAFGPVSLTQLSHQRSPTKNIEIQQLMRKGSARNGIARTDRKQQGNNRIEMWEGNRFKNPVSI